MARLFITPREMNFISDITKEIIKDVVGQKIYLYSISAEKTNSHDVYNEAVQKVFDGPIEIDCLVDSNYQQDTKIDRFGIDMQYKVEVFVQYRDMVDKGININVGDFFSFSDQFYEITEKMVMKNLYGMAEHRNGVKLIALMSRENNFKAKIIGPTDISYTDSDAVQKTFIQQRGFATNANGETNDKRDLIENGVLEKPISGVREVSEQGDKTGAGSSFYDE